MIPLVAPCITVTDRDHIRAFLDYDGLEDEREVARFEHLFAARVGCEWAIATNSGTSGLVVALRVLDLSIVRIALIARRVGVPSYSCMAVRNAVIEESHRSPLYVDVAFSVREARALQEHGAAVLVHLFGRETRIKAGNHPPIEDYTLSLGGVTRLWGDLGVCSTHASKMISTGRGGVVFGNDDGLRDRVRELVHYESHTGFGYSVAMSSMQAALGVSQLAQLDTFIERRRELAARYTDAFRPAGIECPDADCGSVFFRYLINVDWPKKKVQALADLGIEAGRGVYPPLHRLAGLSDDHFPGTTAAVNSLLSVPVHPSITDEQAGHIIESVLEVCAP